MTLICMREDLREQLFPSRELLIPKDARRRRDFVRKQTLACTEEHAELPKALNSAKNTIRYTCYPAPHVHTCRAQILYESSSEPFTLKDLHLYL